MNPEYLIYGAAALVGGGVVLGLRIWLGRRRARAALSRWRAARNPRDDEKQVEWDNLRHVRDAEARKELP